jgi:hypothetical protein
MFLNTDVLQGGVVSTSPNPQAGGPSLVGCPRLLIQFIRSYPPYQRPFLYPQPEDAPWRGDRDPLTCRLTQGPNVTTLSAKRHPYLGAGEIESFMNERGENFRRHVGNFHYFRSVRRDTLVRRVRPLICTEAVSGLNVTEERRQSRRFRGSTAICARKC